MADCPGVVLIVLDGVRWQEIYRGVDSDLADKSELGGDERGSGRRLMPNLWNLIETRGIALGHPDERGGVEASGPDYVSLPGYAEIFTGRTSAGCFSNDCEPHLTSTLADEFRALAGARDEDVAIIASWEKIERVAAATPARIVVSTGRLHGASRERLRYDPEASALLDEGERAGPWPGSQGFRPDRITSAIGLRYLAQKKPRFLFLGLGESDEFAHMGDYHNYLGSLRYADQVIGEVVRTLDAMGEAGRRTSLIVTTDHGRSYGFREHGGSSPESRTVWVVGAGGNIPSGGIVPLERTRRLADLAPTIRALAGLPTDTDRGAGSVIEELIRPPASSPLPRR